MTYESQFKKQGFQNFYGTVYAYNELHVYLDSSWPRQWRCRGKRGDYGLFTNRNDAIRCAIGVKLTSLYGDYKIYVHDGFNNEGKFTILKVKKGKLDSQSFQYKGE